MNRIFRAVADLPDGVRLLAAVVAALAVPMGVALALVPVRSSVPNTTVALGLAFVVAALSSTGTRASAALAAISAGVGFDVFHTRPYGSLTINRAADIETTALLLAVGLMVGQLATRNRRHRYLAAEASYDLGRVHAVAEMVAAGEPVDQVLIAVCNELVDLLGLKDCRFMTEFDDQPGPFIERHGAVTWGALRWGFSTTGLPARGVNLVVQHQGIPLGRYLLTPTAGTRVAADRLITAVALADQAGAALAAQGIPQ